MGERFPPSYDDMMRREGPRPNVNPEVAEKVTILGWCITGLFSTSQGVQRMYLASDKDSASLYWVSANHQARLFADYQSAQEYGHWAKTLQIDGVVVDLLEYTL